MHESNATVIRAARNLCLALLLLVLAGSAAFTGILLSANYDRQRQGLNADAREKAVLASSHLDQAIKSLAQTLALLPWSSIRDEQSRKTFTELTHPITDGTGLKLWARDSKLDVVFRSELGGNADEALYNSDGLTDIARDAAGRALRQKGPQLSDYGTDTSAIGGEDLWLVAAAPGTEPILIQARIPATYFSSTLKGFGADGSWLFAILRPDGQFLGRIGDQASLETISFTDQIQPSGAAWAHSLAIASPFGWRVGAATPFATIDALRATNWSWFLLVMALLTALSAAGALSLSRGLALNLEPARFAPAYPNSQEPAAFSSVAPHWPARGDHLREVLAAGGIGTWEYRRGSPMISGDDQAAAALGLGKIGGKKHGIDILRRVEGHDRARLVSALQAAMAENQHVSVDVKLVRSAGVVRYIAVRGAPFRIDATQARGISGIVYDLTEQKQTLARTDSLLREVSHRTKNLLALILAMARLTARSDFDAKSFLKHFALRVAGLSVSQDVIVAANWQGSDLAAVAVAEVDAVARGKADRITISGPSITVSPEAAQNLGIIITELTLNALEHGALSNSTGHVRLSWELPDDARLLLAWRESGGPHFDAASRKGYGWTIIERLSAQGLKATFTLHREENGFRWSFDAPLHSIGERPPPHRS